MPQNPAQKAVILGGGSIGVETAEALVQAGCQVALVEMAPRILRLLDWEMARLVERQVESKAVKLLVNTRAWEFADFCFR